MKELFQVVTLEEARRLILENFKPDIDFEEREITRALGRRIAENVLVAQPVPGFDRSTVDGYAVRAADTFGASESLPVLLNLVGTIDMGCNAEVPLKGNEAVAIATGGMLPPGADAVVMIEYTEKLDDITIEVAKPVAPGDNVLLQGEDINKGEVIVPRGKKIGPYEMGLLAAVGYDEVYVEEPLKVGIISTGEELVAPEETPGPGQVRDINSYVLTGLVEQSGGKPALYGIVKDDKEQLESVLSKAIEENDLVVISGGSSVGVRDLTLDVLSEGLLFHGVAIRPGKPTLAAVINEKIVVGLPGHPASAAISFYLLVKPLIESGSYESKERILWATLNRNISSGPGREDYVRVKLSSVEEENIATPILGKSGLIRTMAEADGLVKIPLHKEGFAAGERVKVILI